MKQIPMITMLFQTFVLAVYVQIVELSERNYDLFAQIYVFNTGSFKTGPGKVSKVM